ncbi:clamp-loader subunit [Ralstonia phage RpY1]|nr:clamp-loader subunit [Ralstonia phage RpY1]
MTGRCAAPTLRGMSAALTISERRSRVEAVISRVLEGVPIREAIKGNFNSVGALYECISGERELSVRFTRAMEIRAELLVDEMTAIADSDDDPQRVRNRVDVRKWIASKLLPKKYGERIDLNVTQTIDIGEALREARSRIVRPIADQSDVVDAQVVDLQDVYPIEPRDEESRTVDATPPADDPTPDIFS